MDPTEAGKPLFATVAVDLDALLGAEADGVEDGAMALCTEGVCVDVLKERKLGEMSQHPAMEVLDVGDGVDDAADAQDVRVLGEERRRDDARFMFARLKVRVRKQKKKRRQRLFAKNIRHKSHRIRPQHPDIPKLARLRHPQRRNPVLHIRRHLHPQLQPNHPPLRKPPPERHQQPAEPTPNVRPLRRPAARKHRLPPHLLRASRIHQRVIRKWIRVRSLSIMFFLSTKLYHCPSIH